MFIDRAKIYVQAGFGGKGCESFYRDKYNRRGTPDGGDGGKGADIIVRADRNLLTLLDFKYNRHFTGAHGAHGGGKKKKGRDAPALVIRVPPGTVISDFQNGSVLRDLACHGDEVCVARGGKGGAGNRHRREATTGEAGEERDIQFDLKLIAQAGLVGFPNAGKSTLLSRISSAHPQIAAYPFTTKDPVLGMVRTEECSFTVCDIPGLIEGSSCGKGLGDRFLRHVERTRLLVHVIDMSGQEGRDPLSDYRAVNKELRGYSSQVARKPQVIVANKMDQAASRANLERFRKKVRRKVYPLSALKNEGLEEFVEALRRKVQAGCR
ncbi:MAG: GTPase ObgE [Candidatus Omnitrophica bacterium]|nr:GTPase ObgE [Candidatus Omnitrophota bacterium]